MNDSCVFAMDNEAVYLLNVEATPVYRLEWVLSSSNVSHVCRGWQETSATFSN